MMAMLMPSLMSMSVMVVGSFGAHLAFGLVLGTVVAASISTGGKSVTMAAVNNPTKQFACPVCGAPFASQNELAGHKAQAHPM
jgi:C2H2-type zinc finger protein